MSLFFDEPRADEVIPASERRGGLAVPGRAPSSDALSALEAQWRRAPLVPILFTSVDDETGRETIENVGQMAAAMRVSAATLTVEMAQCWLTGAEP